MKIQACIPDTNICIEYDTISMELRYRKGFGYWIKAANNVYYLWDGYDKPKKFYSAQKCLSLAKWDKCLNYVYTND